MRKPAPAPCAFLVRYKDQEWLVPAMSANVAKTTAWYGPMKDLPGNDGTTEWLELKVKRAPEHDAWAATAQRRCYTLEEVNGGKP